MSSINKIMPPPALELRNSYDLLRDPLADIAKPPSLSSSGSIDKRTVLVPHPRSAFTPPKKKSDDALAKSSACHLAMPSSVISDDDDCVPTSRCCMVTTVVLAVVAYFFSGIKPDTGVVRSTIIQELGGENVYMNLPRLSDDLIEMDADWPILKKENITVDLFRAQTPDGREIIGFRYGEHKQHIGYFWNRVRHTDRWYAVNFPSGVTDPGTSFAWKYKEFGQIARKSLDS